MVNHLAVRAEVESRIEDMFDIDIERERAVNHNVDVRRLQPWIIDPDNGQIVGAKTCMDVSSMYALHTSDFSTC